jgi:hypothetical protein
VEFLPGYAPELNPVEWLWSQLKDVELCNKPCMDLEELHEKLHVAIARIRQHPERIFSFFAGAKVTSPRSSPVRPHHGHVEPGRSVPLAANTKVSFGKVEGEIRSNAVPIFRLGAT